MQRSPSEHSKASENTVNAQIKRPKAVIDAHHHVWDLRNDIPWLKHERIPFRYGDYSPMCHDYLPEDYRADTSGWPVAGSVYVEAEWNRSIAAEESAWVAEVSRQTGVPTVMVAWCDFAAANAAELLAAHAKHDVVRGVRHKPASVSNAQDSVRGASGSMDDPKWRDGYALLEKHGWSYDLQTPWWHLEAAGDLARDFPNIPLIINHTGLPSDRSAEALAGWRRSLECAAAQPNVFIKISGIGLPGQPWTVENNGPIIRDTISIFGTDRVMFASNFPVDGLVGDFDTIFSGFAEATSDLADEIQARLFHDNAVRIYRMPIAK